MRAFDEFQNMDTSFWAFIKFLSESLGYTDRGRGMVRAYTFEEMKNLCLRNQIHIKDEMIQDAVLYTDMRANLLNNFAQPMLMTAEEASKEFAKWEKVHRIDHFHCKLPLNKQKGEKKQIAFFTSIINILTEKTIREATNITDTTGFDDDPHNLCYILDDKREIIGASSRRFDGIYPDNAYPRLVWEIKEYYYATTFGSRVADGVYETQLDGLEFKELYDRTGYKVYHVLFIDAYRTWWVQGKSYLCRLIDAMNSGAVDEVIVGKEVFSRWPALL